MVAPDKEGLGLLRCINIALKSSRLNISCIDYINAHATSTLLGD
ncbi:hypothetical protein E5P55_01250 [Candidatus Pinguicoccus supinus]|uniref:Beta-ketoacyl synthase C-terminal domain-containing protein n=1 Tax=Candidatus Pinguicoccus supinus TaxID=2529394 RepID=A0A7T0BRQ8_9BACT|nr:hypothetical protein E5P55_01250 [Candidatus Pinguicoccus supinus]